MKKPVGSSGDQAAQHRDAAVKAVRAAGGAVDPGAADDTSTGASASSEDSGGSADSDDETADDQDTGSDSDEPDDRDADADGSDKGGDDEADEGDGADDDASDSDEPDDDDSDSDEDSDTQLLPASEMERLKSNPRALAKALQRAFTKKTQKLGEARKLAQRLSEDPDGLLAELAAARGVTLAKSDSKEAKGASDDGSDKSAEIVAQVLGNLKTAFASHLSPEAADQLTSTIASLVQHTTKAATAPLAAELQRTRTAAAATEAERDTAIFKKRHPDWAKHEKAMGQLATQLQPKGMRPLKFLEMLYGQVTGNTRRAADKTAGAKAATDRLKRSAAAAEPKPSNAGQKRVQTGPPKNLTSRSAAEAALAGITWSR